MYLRNPDSGRDFRHFATVRTSPTEPTLAEFAAQANSAAANPTAEAYGEWQRAFSYFNERLFAGELPNCLITYTGRPSVLGYFCAGAFQDDQGVIAHEIAMNPSWFADRGDADGYFTLAHEMCHLWRHLSGRRNRKGGTGARGYHDVVWADAMERIGLVPSSTEMPGGRRTGFRISHYLVEGGPFDLACREPILSGETIAWRDGRRTLPSSPGGLLPVLEAPKNTRTRFVCSGCDLKAWARASARLSCDDCDSPLITR